MISWRIFARGTADCCGMRHALAVHLTEFVSVRVLRIHFGIAAYR